MPTDNIAAIDERVLQIPGGEKLKLLIVDQYGSIRGWARAHGFESTEVYYTLNGQRPYPQIREKLAETLQIERADIDLLIDGAKAA